MTDPSSPRYATGLRRIAEGLTEQPIGVIVRTLYNVSDEDIDAAVQQQRESGGKLGDILVQRGSLTEEQLAACLAILVKKETTFLSHAFLSPLRFKWWGRHAQLTMESFALMLVTFVVVHRLLGLGESGLIAIFLASAALTTRLNVVLADINTKNEVVDILAMFVGLFLVFVGVATLMDPSTIPKSFGFVMTIADMDTTTTLYDRSFGDFGGIVAHNLLVLCSGVLLGFLYRGYATLLLLAWNAAVWGLTLTLLFRQSFLASGVDALAKELSKRVKIPTFEVITNFHRTHAFIDNYVTQVDTKLKELQDKGIKPDRLVISFHGMQKRRIIEKGDDYYRHCYETFRLIVNKLEHLQPDQAVMTFQSRFGSEEWITPYTEEVVEDLIKHGHKEIVVCSPSFVADCLETTDELGHELVHEAKEWGGNIYPVDCLNTNEQWCKDFAKYTFTQAEGSAQDKEDLEYQLQASDYEEMPVLVMSK